MFIERRVLTFSRRFLFALFVVYRGDPAALNDRWSRRMEQSMGRVIESLLTASSLFPALSRILLRGRRGGEGWKAVLMAAIGSKTNNLGGGDKGTGWCGQIIARTGGISGRASSVRTSFLFPFRSLAFDHPPRAPRSTHIPIFPAADRNFRYRFRVMTRS